VYYYRRNPELQHKVVSEAPFIICVRTQLRPILAGIGLSERDVITGVVCRWLTSFQTFARATKARQRNSITTLCPSM
jgi:hypothetical protein